MTTRREFLLRAAAASVMLGASVFVAVRTAVARDGRVGSARSFVTVAGTLTNLPVGTTTATVTFEFQRREGAATTALCAQTVSATLGAGGAFSVPVPVATPESTCPDDIFDGRDVWVRALYGGGEVAAWAPVNPVPYAHFASVAGTAAVATQYGTPDCPVGYERVTESGFTADMRLCARSRGDGTHYDEVVRVGAGASAFWIDRFEASVWRDAQGTRGYLDSPTVAFGTMADNYTSDFPDNGQWSGTSAPAYALSAVTTPSRFLTWFQAEAACRASGKRLATGPEWIAAARGTPDPGESNGSGERCVTSALAVVRSGQQALCRSAWGAHDMIGNVWEWTAEWFPGVGDSSRTTPNAMNTDGWGTGYEGDGTWNVTSSVATPDVRFGVPAAALRGGSTSSSTRAGVFAVSLSNAPTQSDLTLGFRCVIPR